MPYLVGLAGLVLFWVVIGLFSGSWNPLKLFEGMDKRPSSSKLQFLLWTAAVIFGYLAIYANPIAKDTYDFNPIKNVPSSLLIAMGISGATAVAAKAVTTTNLAKGKVKLAFNAAAAAALPAGAARTPATTQGGVFQADDGSPDLGKIQMIVWTLIAIGVFLAQVFSKISAPSATKELPDIGQSLMVLMGLGHAAYVGKKVAE